MTNRYMDFVPAKPTVKMSTATPRTRMSRQMVVRQNTVVDSGITRQISTNKTAARRPAATRTVKAKPAVRMTRTTTVSQTSVVRVAKPAVTDRVSVTRVAKPVAAKPVMTKPVTAGPRAVNQTPAVLFETAPKDGFGSESKLGVIEELNPHFVTTNVAKRPLGQGLGTISDDVPSYSAKDELASAKSKKVGGRFRGRKAAKANSEPKRKSARKKDDYKVPNSPFINQDKVEKRPLSKNMYQSNKTSTSKTKATGEKPVTIIAKPEKESHVGMIVTIILTIILGAVAGTVAFLLLPK